MLTQEPVPGDRESPSEYKPPSALVTAALTLLVLAVLVLRHDYWWWNDVRPLLFGFLPVGLWWQALVSILACIMMALMVRYAWPGWLEHEATEGERRRLEQRK